MWPTTQGGADQLTYIARRKFLDVTLEDTQLCQLTLAENGKKDFYWGKWQLTLNFVNEHSTWSIDMRFVRVYHVFC